MRKTPESQRKEPKQGRSKALVDAIMEATVRILPSIGSENLTTRKVADFAGVSIGSFYQYFPNKESLLGSLMDFALQSRMNEVRRQIEELSKKEFWEAVDGITDFMIAENMKDGKQLREIFRRVAELGRLPMLMKARRDGVELLADALIRYYPTVPREEARRLMFVAANSTLGVIDTMLYDETQNYTVAELQTELKAQTRAYLRARISESTRSEQCPPPHS